MCSRLCQQNTNLNTYQHRQTKQIKGAQDGDQSYRSTYNKTYSFLNMCDTALLKLHTHNTTRPTPSAANKHNYHTHTMTSTYSHSPTIQQTYTRLQYGCIQTNNKPITTALVLLLDDQEWEWQFLRRVYTNPPRHPHTLSSRLQPGA